MRLNLNAEQAAAIQNLWKSAKHPGVTPDVIVGQLRRDTFPAEPVMFLDLARLSNSEAIAMRKALLKIREKSPKKPKTIGPQQ